MVNKILVLLVVLNCDFGFSQVANDRLVKFIEGAEKVIIASHEDFNLVVRQPGRSKTLTRTLLKKGKPNKKIMKEEMQLSSGAKAELIAIISAQKRDSIWEGASCFWPHHTLFIYSQQKWSYIDLCFGCHKYSYSKDLKINEDEFLVTYEDWRKLESFFRKNNLNYELPKRRD